MKVPVILGIDPGLRSVGLALFEGSVLTHVAWLKNPEQYNRDMMAVRAMPHEVYRFLADDSGWPHIDKIVIERQTIYPNRIAKLEDVIFLAQSTGGIATYLEADTVVGYLPRQWKGNTDKEEFTTWITKHLSPQESALLEGMTGKKLSDVVDAIGIALFELGRLTKYESPPKIRKPRRKTNAKKST